MKKKQPFQKMELVPCKKNRLEQNWIRTYIFKYARAWKMIAAREKNPKRQKKTLTAFYFRA